MRREHELTEFNFGINFANLKTSKEEQSRLRKYLMQQQQKLNDYGYPYKFVANVHDEFQLEVPEEYADRVGVCVRNAIRQAGRDLGLRCPLDGEYMVGDSWAETH